MNNIIPITQDLDFTNLEASLYLPNCCYLALLCATNHLPTLHETIVLNKIYLLTAQLILVLGNIY